MWWIGEWIWMERLIRGYVNGRTKVCMKEYIHGYMKRDRCVTTGTQC